MASQALKFCQKHEYCIQNVYFSVNAGRLSVACEIYGTLHLQGTSITLIRIFSGSIRSLFEKYTYKYELLFFAVEHYELVACADSAAVDDLCEYALVRHDASPHLVVYLTVRVTFLTYLSHFQYNVVALETCAYRERLEIEAANENVFAECSRYYACALFVELIDLFL